MSMISALIDELNKSADEWNSSNMFELARMCREAADTIWELRDDLQRTNDAVQNAEHDESMAWDRVRKAEAEADKLREQGARLFDKTLELGTENAKLRELVADMWFWSYEGHIDSESQERQMLHIDAVIQRMRELGIEVDA